MENRFEEINQLINGTSSDKIIEIRSVYKNGIQTVQPAFSPKTNWYAGVERLSDAEKEKRSYYVVVGKMGDDARHNTKFKLENGVIFDLNNEVDRINWEWVKYSPSLAMSLEEAQMGKALFYIHIEGREAELSNKTSEEMFEALRYVMEDPQTNYVNRALLLGMDMEEENPAVIKQYLLDMAKKSPKAILRIYRDKALRLHLLFAKAQKEGHIKKDEVQGVFKYGTTILGVSDETCIAYLQSNPDLLELLERDVKPAYFEAKQKQAKTTPAERAQLAREAKAATQ